ncbi:hypothetical protein GGS24DRAFT_241115 [Hypoxylon argillaceum]|nr:hypothetical protein GGS24DRAFT_241115 [Hypoxylon argillaceum]
MANVNSLLLQKSREFIEFCKYIWNNIDCGANKRLTEIRDCLDTLLQYCRRHSLERGCNNACGISFKALNALFSFWETANQHHASHLNRSPHDSSSCQDHQVAPFRQSPINARLLVLATCILNIIDLGELAASRFISEEIQPDLCSLPCNH